MYPAKGQETAQAIFDAIIANPKQHNQSVWMERTAHCGTTRCVAGWARHVHGHTDTEISSGAVPAEDYPSAPANLLTGADLLDISYADARVLFYRTSNEEALTAIEWLARGKKLNWDEILTSRYAEPRF